MVPTQQLLGIKQLFTQLAFLFILKKLAVNGKYKEIGVARNTLIQYAATLNDKGLAGFKNMTL